MRSETKQSGTHENSAELYTDGSYLKNNPSWGVEDSPWKAAQIAKKRVGAYRKAA